MSRPLQGKLGRAYEQCRDEGKIYAQCIEQKLEGGGFGHRVCEKEFAVLRECIREKYHPVSRAGSNPFSGR